MLSPVTWILFLAGFFDGISDNWLHALVLWAAAYVVARDVARRARGVAPPPARVMFSGSGPRRPELVTLLVAAAVAYATVAGSFDRYTWPITAVVVLPGVLVLAVAWPGPLWPRAVPARARTLGTALWATVFVAAGLWELAALLMQPTLQGGSYSHPTISYLMDTVLSHQVGRSVTLLAWIALGAFLLTRCTASGAAPIDGDGRGDER
ncbi:MAG: hypothetical protein ABI468_09985 [Candidatus Nanopelagicales bacterium]